jgi:hypothetical protein
MGTVWILWVFVMVDVKVMCSSPYMIPRYTTQPLCTEKQEEWRYTAIYDPSSVLAPRKSCEEALLALPDLLISGGKSRAQCLPVGVDPARLAPE